MKKILVVARSLREFINQFPEMIGDDVRTANSRGTVTLKDGTVVKFVGSMVDLQGCHGVDVQIWGMPTWALDDLSRFEAEVKLARGP